ncbi:hypothetical protein [Coleofasciculus sp. FACHB-SPT36]|nr:hypothetical protein [Coleofasciculus sp. FACHB-SPT36]MBD2538540.1 hypothetical protein [Coleofasciculus sp. FACHB-SPT36]
MMNDLSGVSRDSNEPNAIALTSSRRQIHLFNYGLPPYLKPLISLQ